MALFNGVKRVDGSRSNTALVKSGHMSPATDWKLDPKFKANEMSAIFRDGVLFQYQYGGPGDTDVVIAKGRLVGVSTPVKDFEDGILKTVVTLPGLSLGNNIVGVAPYNFTKDMLQEDRFGGNHPSVITLDYITVPYMPGIAPATTMDMAGLLDEETRISVNMKMPWGALIGEAQVGDHVKGTASGRFTKWVSGTDADHLRVGQILEMDLNQEPWGWMKWVLWDPSARKEDDSVINRSGASNLPSDGGYPYDPKYAEGMNIFQQYQTEFVTNPTGIPGLHDGSGNYYGYGRNDQEFTNIALGTIDAGTPVDTLVQFQAKNAQGGDLVNLQEGVKVFVGGTEVAADHLTINYQTGKITVKVATQPGAPVAVTGTYKAFFYGTPSYLDFKGVVGSASILLKL